MSAADPASGSEDSEMEAFEEHVEPDQKPSNPALPAQSPHEPQDQKLPSGRVVNKFDPAGLPELLRVYYKKLFPYGLFYRWLNYGHTEDSRTHRNFFSLREFCLTLKDDVYLRYKSFENQKEMEHTIQHYNPHKIDIGPVYSARIKDSKISSSVVAVERELIFDIDMSDYNEVRLCPCSGTEMCALCWPLMALAVKILHRALTEDFGFQYILWVFSGRRGIHCWVCDKKARSMQQHAREAVVKYLSLITGGNVGKARHVHINDFQLNHFAVKKAMDYVEPFFLRNLVNAQDLMESEVGLPKVLAMLEDSVLAEKVKKSIDNMSGSQRRWEKLSSEVGTYLAQQKPPASYEKANMLKEIEVQFCYPRLDINVSHSVNHLLKSPFSVHPKTGRVCVPINPDTIDSFKPFEVPTIDLLVEEMNAYDAANPLEASAMDTDAPDEIKEKRKSVPEWKKTSLKEGVGLLEYFVKKLEASWKREKREAEDSKMDF